ncbi:type IV secretion system DNA-binding domain-containing protein [Candidatus Azambacteria bacterium]|nr:type IV secretion system DNA-binding domain-containing protein [Candidatus Azambacteria bacterium]
MPYFLIVLVILISLFVLFLLSRKIFRGKILRSLNMKLLLIILPPAIFNKEEKKTEKEIIAVMDQLYSAFSVIQFSKKTWLAPKPYLVLELVVPQVGEEIHFYLACPWRLTEAITKQIYSYFPLAKVENIAKDYTIFTPGGKVAATMVKFNYSSILPFKTYKDLEVDPLKEITNSFSRLKEVGEGAVIQIAFRPASHQNKKRSLRALKLIKNGKNLGEALEKVNQSWFWDLIDFFKTDHNKKESGEDQFKREEVHEEVVKALTNKASKAQFETNIRIVASAPTQEEAEDILRYLANSFSQFDHPILNSFFIHNLKKEVLKKTIFDFSYRLFDKKKMMILGTEELTSLYHFPNVVLETPKIKFLKAKPSEPPVNLPKEGLILGKNFYRGEEKEVRMSQEDRRRHLYTIGQTGTGKSTFLKNLIQQDINNGEGVGVLDPHGDLVEDILGLIPKHRVEDVIVLDASDLERPLGLNMLEYDPKFPEQKTFIINELISILDKLYDLKTTGGPMFEQYTRNSLLLLLEYPERGFTLMEIPRVLADKEFRKSLLKDCTNIIAKDFWEKEAEKAGGEASLQNMVPYITSKFGIFISNDYVRPIIGQSKSTINFRDLMDHKKILLVSLSKGRLGDINSSLLGLVIVGKLLMASFSRVDQPEDQRQDFYLYLDEFQNFATNSIATILSEARKYRLDLVIAHQFIEQLKKEIKDAVFGNVGSAVSFRVGAADAEAVVKQFFEPVFNQNDLVNIDNFNAYIKLMINNTTTKPFSIAVNRPDKPNIALAKNIRELSRLKYGRDYQIVKEEIASRYLWDKESEE